MDDVTIDQLVAVDRKMNERLTELQTQMDAIEEQRSAVRDTILKIMNEQNATSISTAHGTVSRTVKNRYWTNDWTVLHQYILEHGAVDLLEKRVHQTNMKEWIDAHPNDYPPGLNVDREFSITIRKPRRGANSE